MVGIMGGTFDPVHYGHLRLAEHIREEFGLEGILFMPAGSPPHKRGPHPLACQRVACGA